MLSLIDYPFWNLVIYIQSFKHMYNYWSSNSTSRDLSPQINYGYGQSFIYIKLLITALVIISKLRKKSKCLIIGTQLNVL